MLIVTDIDECVLGWADGFYHWLTSNGYNIKTDWRNYDCVEDWLDDNLQNWNMDLIHSFNHDESFSKLEPIKKSYIFIPLLYQMGHNFVALTACGTDPKTIENRNKNIHSLFPNIFKNIICVDSGKDKFEYLKMLNGSYWIEDNFQNAFYGTQLDYETFIIDYHHNRISDHGNIHRVDDWEQIYNKIV